MPKHSPPDSADTPTQLETLIGVELHSELGEDTLTKPVVLGRYQVQRELGHGGMGRVFLACQTEPVERTVALKLIRRRLINPHTLARFEIEQQALARMHHPAIAQVHEVGTTPQGHPYFSMEYVDGQPLNQYCRDQRLTLDERLHLFILICNGVQHAHLKGIIHRDLKPANILVAQVDGQAQPKIIDFGIAAATSDSQETDLPGTGRAGTPEYMSPELLSGDSRMADVRSDVYSLGVILHELMIEHPPIKRSRFRTDDQPDYKEIFSSHSNSAPSALLDSDQAIEIARLRRTTPRRLKKQMRGDLDRIVLKAIELDPDQRYASAGELADEVRRFMKLLPVSVTRPTAGYLFGKFIRRHAVATVSISSIVVALSIGLVVALVSMNAARNQAMIAEQRQAQLEQVVRFQESMLSDIDAQTMGVNLIDDIRAQYMNALERFPQLRNDLPDAGQLDLALGQISTTDLARNIVDRDILNRARTAIETDFAEHPSLQSDLFETLFGVYHALEMHKPLVWLADEIERLRSPIYPEHHPHRIRAVLRLAQAAITNGQSRDALELLEPVLAKVNFDAPELRSVYLPLLKELAAAYSELAMFDQALAAGRTALAEARHMDADPDLLAASILELLAIIHTRAGQAERGVEFLELALAKLQASDLAVEHRVLSVRVNLGPMLGSLGRHQEALENDSTTLEQVVTLHGRRHPQALRLLGNIAIHKLRLGEIEQAVRVQAEVVELRRDIMGPRHPMTLRSMLNLGSTMISAGRHEEALDILEHVANARQKLFGADHADTLMAREVMANAYLEKGLPETALELAEAVRKARSEVLGPEHPRTVATGYLTALSYRALGRPEAGIDLLSQFVTQQYQRMGPENESLIQSAWVLYEVLSSLDRLDEARQVRAHYLSWLEQADPAELDANRRSIQEKLTAIIDQPQPSGNPF